MVAGQELVLAGPVERPFIDPLPVLEISLFGGFVASYDGREVQIPNKKGKALLGYLAFTRTHSETRERLCGMLWGDSSEVNARNSLRQTLKSLREMLEAAGYTGFNTFYSDPGFEPGSVRFDVVEAMASIADDWPLDELVDKTDIESTVLIGFEDVDPAYRTWLTIERGELGRRMQRSLEDRMNAQPGATPAARRLAQALLNLDPTYEPASRIVMRACADAGDFAGAIDAHNRLCEVLAAKHAQPPSDETDALIVAIKDGSYRPSGRVGEPTGMPLGLLGNVATTKANVGVSEPPPERERLVLVVGRFPTSTTGDLYAFAFRHELVSSLIGFREWVLVDGDDAPLQLASTMPCYRLSAGFEEGGQQLGLRLSLTDNRTGRLVWNQAYQIDLSNLHESRKSVIREIAAKLNVYISVERLNRLAAAPDISLEIYDRWLRAQSLIYQYSASNRGRIRSLLESITTDAPGFSPAYSSLAQMDNSDHIVLAGTYRTIETHQRALRSAKLAVEMDPFDSRAHLASAWAHAFGGKFEQSFYHFEQALSLNEHDAWTATSAALGFAFGNDHVRAREAAEKSSYNTLSRGPLYWCYHSNIRFLEGDYEGALEAAEHCGDAVVNLPGWNAAAYALLGRHEEATVEARRFLCLIRGVWKGESDPSDAAVVRWFLRCFPLRNPDARETLRHGLVGAGLFSG